MKATIIFISAFLGIFLLSACSNDDEIIPKDDSWYWGYFKGTINGNQLSIENAPYERPVETIKTSICPGGGLDSIRGMITVIKYSETEVLDITLYSLHEGIRNITKAAAMADWNRDGINITRATGIPTYEDQYIFYLPSKEKPFQVKVISCVYIDSEKPVIEAELDGVLYHEKNPLDSIVVKGYYGTR